MFGFLNKRKFKKELERAAADGVLDAKEKTFLEKLSSDLAIDQQYVNELRETNAKNQVKHYIDNIKQSRRFSPKDEQNIKQILDGLNIASDLSNEFKKERALWLYENEGKFELIPKTVDINLDKKELCYFSCYGEWKQVANVKQYVGSHGTSVSFRVAKGVRISTGRSVPIYKQYETIKDISIGTVFITNKRIVFSGNKKSTNLTYKRILNFNSGSDYVEIIKSSGKPDIIKMDEIDIDYLRMILNEILKEN